jgi:hypothetical protein
MKKTRDELLRNAAAAAQNAIAARNRVTVTRKVMARSVIQESARIANDAADAADAARAAALAAWNIEAVAIRAVTTANWAGTAPVTRAGDVARAAARAAARAGDVALAAARAASIAAYDVGEITAVTKVNAVWSAAVAAWDAAAVAWDATAVVGNAVAAVWDAAVAKKGKKNETITAGR